MINTIEVEWYESSAAVSATVNGKTGLSKRSILRQLAPGERTALMRDFYNGINDSESLKPDIKRFLLRGKYFNIEYFNIENRMNRTITRTAIGAPSGRYFLLSAFDVEHFASFLAAEINGN